MYDTVNYWLNLHNPYLISQYLDSCGEKYSGFNNKTKIFGNLKNLKVIICETGISIKGSLAKFYFGNNIETLTLKQIKDITQEISDSLHLSMDMANVTRIDIATNFNLQEKVSYYLNLLADYSRFQRTIYKSTVYYKSKTKKTKYPKELCFYDKIAECKDRNLIHNKNIENTNLLRYELRLNGRLPQQLKRKEVCGNTLYQPDFYDYIINKWADCYFKIKKIKMKNEDYMKNLSLKTTKEGLYALITVFLNSPNGITFLNNTISEFKNAFPTARKYNDFKNFVYKIQSDERITEPNELILELDKKVKDIQKNHK